jgi:glycosyltransferase involved in cell wall biosynthesis
MPLVSIIIPNYNHGSYLEERLTSVFNQTFSDFEVIILDDCSTDNSRDIISLYNSDPRISKIILNETNSGSPFTQWIKGLQEANGEYIWIAESDDASEQTFLETCLKHIGDEADIVYTDSWVVRDWKKMTETVRHIDESYCSLNGSETIKKYMLFDNFIPNASAVIFKKSVIPSAIFSTLEKFKWCGDWFFWLSLLHQSKIIFLPQKLNIYRRHSDSTTAHFSKKGYEFKEIFPELVKLKSENNFSVKTDWLFFVHWSKKLHHSYTVLAKKQLIIFSPWYYFVLLNLSTACYFVYKKIKTVLKK